MSVVGWRHFVCCSCYDVVVEFINYLLWVQISCIGKQFNGRSVCHKSSLHFWEIVLSGRQHFIVRPEAQREPDLRWWCRYSTAISLCSQHLLHNKLKQKLVYWHLIIRPEDLSLKSFLGFLPTIQINKYSLISNIFRPLSALSDPISVLVTEFLLQEESVFEGVKFSHVHTARRRWDRHISGSSDSSFDQSTFILTEAQHVAVRPPQPQRFISAHQSPLDVLLHQRLSEGKMAEQVAVTLLRRTEQNHFSSCLKFLYPHSAAVEGLKFIKLINHFWPLGGRT